MNESRFFHIRFNVAQFYYNTNQRRKSRVVVFFFLRICCTYTHYSIPGQAYTLAILFFLLLIDFSIYTYVYGEYRRRLNVKQLGPFFLYFEYCHGLLVSSKTKDEKGRLKSIQKENQIHKPQFEFSLNAPVSFTFILIGFQSYNKMDYEFYSIRPLQTEIHSVDGFSFVSVYSDLYINKCFSLGFGMPAFTAVLIR